ncbi:MAG: hypothetical protein ACI9WU_003590 [Myxococcota bacterium]|jgi:hypothetical protein
MRLTPTMQTTIERRIIERRIKVLLRRGSLALGLLFALEATAGGSQVRPARPNVDSNVSIQIPHGPGSGCSVTARVRREAGRGRTLLQARAAPSGRCRAVFAPGKIWHRLGQLKAGRYVVVTSAGRRSFTVLPVVAAPEARKSSGLLHVRKAVLDVVPATVCPIGDEPERQVRRLRRKHPRIWKAAGKYWPRVDEETRWKRVQQLRRVKLKWVKAARYRYTVSTGCGTERKVSGFVSIAPRLQVDPPGPG